MSDTSWSVNKFGGGSLAGAAEFRAVARILMETGGGARAAVVSASAGITDRLMALVDDPAEESAAPGMAGIRDHHLALAEALLPQPAVGDYVSKLDKDLETVAAIVGAVRLLGRSAPEARSLVSGFGEVWSARLLSAHLSSLGVSSEWLHAGDVLTIRDSELGPIVMWEESRRRLESRMPADPSCILVITGYVAREESGVPTTLGRNGSDFSASIFGRLLDAREIVIWTDVDGVMSGDPRRVNEAAVIPELSYHEAMELAYFGAKVIHPRTMGPAVEKGIPIYIRNTFRPQGEGTRISAEGGDGNRVKGISTVDGIALVNLEGAGMIGVPGTADRLFGALRESGISVVMISQGSSEHSICFAVPEADANRAADVVSRAFALELEQKQIQGLDVTVGCSILAVVGDGMRGMPGIAAKLFGALGRAGVNVRAIAQGASERNISAVIDAEEATRAVKAVHSGFYLSPQTISVGLIGAGTVGSALLEQFAAELPRLRRDFKLDLRIRGIATSRRMLLGEQRIDPAGWEAAIERDGQNLDLEAFVEHVHAEHLPHAVLIDCTADQGIADRYAGWLEDGLHVVTPNKKANTASLDYYLRLMAARMRGGSRYLYETTVGAGLPIVHTLRDLRQTGDAIIAIEGVLSGTLAYLFNVFDGSRPFSAIVRDARDMGYTEPDPRDDLSGMDVARKVVILGREMGLPLELSGVKVESLVPEGLDQGDVDSFLDGLTAHDDVFNARLARAHDAGEVLRYVGRLHPGGEVSVALEQLPGDHPFARINLTDNIVQFRTRRYHDNPLIVRGPGAGPAVTAAGVFSDLLRLCANLGANL
jgi:aspartokinase/homoserine dehydrogenase 1